eukprot:175428-Pyramimonas_sp.AAC.1
MGPKSASDAVSSGGMNGITLGPTRSRKSNHFSSANLGSSSSMNSAFMNSANSDETLERLTPGRRGNS